MAGVTTNEGGFAASGDRFEVDPEALIRDGRELVSLGNQLGALSESLGAALSEGIASGTDLAGTNFGFTYGDLAQNFADYLAMAANASKSVGYMLEATGVNYKNADAASTVGGPGPTGGVGEPPEVTTAADASLGPTATRTPPPGLWRLVEPWVPFPWPSGVPALMNVTAAQWENYANGFAVVQAQVDGVKTAVSMHVRYLAEAPKINEAMQALHGGVAHLADLAADTADAVTSFATGVQEAQDAIRRILDRISSSGLIDTIKGVFSGDGLTILRQVADDVGAVLKYLQSQVKAVVGLLEQLTEALGDAMTGLQKWVRPKLESVFGKKIGRELAAQFTLFSDINVGTTTGLVKLVSGVVAMADPDTWKGMYELGMSVLADPTKLDDVLTTMVKEVGAYDALNSDHPGRGIGESFVNVVSSINPSGAASKAGMASRVAKGVKGLAENRNLSKLSDLAKLGAGKGRLDALDGRAGTKAPELTEFAPAPRIPESIIGATGPDGAGAPVGRPGPDGPAAPAESPNPRAYHGVGDDPPDPPGRATGPSESGFADSVAPAQQFPESAGQGHPVDSPHSPVPSAGDPASPASTHAPEPSSPAGTPEPVAPPSPHNAAPSLPEQVQPQASHQAPNTETHNAGNVSEGQEHGPGPGSGADTHPRPDGHAPEPTQDSPHHPDEPSDDPHSHDGHTDPDGVTPEEFAAEHPPLHRDDPYPPKHMLGMFDDETDPLKEPFKGKSVERWAPEVIEQHRVVVDENGLLRHIDGRLLDTGSATSHWTPTGGRAIFTMDPHGNLFVSLEQDPGRIHHSTLSGGKPVAGAGELAVVNGRLTELTGNSGHYRPLRSNTQNVLDELSGRGVDVGSVSIDWIAPEGT